MRQARLLAAAAALAAAPVAAQVPTAAPGDAPTADRATLPREFTQSLTPPPPAAPPVTTVAKPFLQLAGESDVFEISSSQVALQRSQNPEVRRYAAMLVQVGSSRVDLQACKLEYSIVSPK